MTLTILARRKFQAYGTFTSGVGIQYSESSIVDTKHQIFAKNLIIGKRILPQILVRAADARPYELQDLLPADTRFKILVFAGDTTDAVQRTKVEKLAEEMDMPESFLKTYNSGEDRDKVFDILAISSGKKEHVNYTELPELFRSHWSKYYFPFLPGWRMLLISCLTEFSWMTLT
jgi:phenol 2-monooxygenase